MTTAKERFKEVREYLNLSQQKIADSIDFKPNTINNIENGKQKSIPYELAYALCQKYNISIHWLITGEGEMLVKRMNTLEVTHKDIRPEFKNFGRRLNKLSVGSGLLSWQMAEILGLSDGIKGEEEFSELCLGKKQPTLELVLKICENFDITADKLLFDRE